MRNLFCSFLVITALLLGAGARAQTITVGALTLTPCIHQYHGYCGTLSRAVDPAGTVPGSIAIGFEFYPHTDTATPGAGTIAAQEGGPGYATTGSRDGYVRLLTPLRDHRDILLIDKRGEIVRRWVGKTDFVALGKLIEALQRES